MIAEDQTAAVAFLSAPASHGTTEPVETMETHISRIFLVGGRAFKMKRAVKLPYVDFSTASLRLDACRKEVELNAATAPRLYLGVRRITREKDGALTFDGRGELVDSVVEMVRFDQRSLFDRMAVAGRLTRELMTVAAQMIARFHRAAPVVHEGEALLISPEFSASMPRVLQRAGSFDRTSSPPSLSHSRGASRAMRHCSIGARRQERSGAATAICICVTSACSRASHGCSIASSSTIRSPRSTHFMTSPFS